VEAPALAIRLASVLRGRFVDAAVAQLRLVVVQLPSGLLLCRHPADPPAPVPPAVHSAASHAQVRLPSRLNTWGEGAG
jgi:hypothetical protein